MNPYEQLLFDCAANDSRIVVMTAENRGHIRNLPKAIGERFIDVGIAEMTMIGAAAGMAVQGRIVVTHALASFLTMRSFEFIRDDVGIPSLPVIMVGMIPGFLSDGNGPTHQAIEDVSLMRTIPNIGVFCPSDEVDLVLGMPHILQSGAPFYVRYTNQPAVVEHDPLFVIGRSELVHGSVQTETDVTILTYGMLLREAIRAALELENVGISVRVVNLRTLKPIDEAALIEAALTSSLVVTLEDHLKVGGLYSIFSELMIGRRVMPNVLPIALDEKWFRPGRLNEVLEYEGFTAQQIVLRITHALGVTRKNHHVGSTLS